MGIAASVQQPTNGKEEKDIKVEEDNKDTEWKLLPSNIEVLV
jgi:hypothetical protein